MSRAKKLPSGNWRVNQYIGKDGAGKRIYKSFTAKTKREAEYMAASFLADRKSSGRDITVKEAISRYIQSKDAVLSPTTVRGYEVILQYHLQGIMDLPLSSLTRERIQREINSESRRCSAKTVMNVYGLLSAAIKMHDPSSNINITLPRRIKRLKFDLPTSEEVISAVSGSEIELPVLLALCMCLRMSEVRAVRKSAVDGDMLLIDRVIVPVKGKQIEKELAKTDASRRMVRLTPTLKKMIMSSESDYITSLTGRAIYGRFVNIMKRNGYYGVRFHDLRHIAASDMHRLGITDKVASERGGWSGTQTMREVYQHSFSADRQAADDIISKYYEKMLHRNDPEK